MNKGILSKWECPSCDNILKAKQTLVSNAKGTKMAFDSPKECNCGNKDEFKLLSFGSGTVTIVPDSEVVMEEDEEPEVEEVDMEDLEDVESN